MVFPRLHNKIQPDNGSGNGSSPPNSSEAPLAGKFLKALRPILEKKNITQIPQKLLPFSKSSFTNFMESIDPRAALDVDFLIKGGVSVDDAPALMDRINQDLKQRIGRAEKEHPIHLENRNLIAISGCAVIMYYGQEIYKYPLNDIFEMMMVPEIENHEKAASLLKKWEESSLPNHLKNKLGVPSLSQKEGLYSMQYVNRSLDMVAMQDIIYSIMPTIDEQLYEFDSHLHSLSDLQPAQLMKLVSAIIKENIPQMANHTIERGEWLSILINCGQSYLTRDHYAALNSFLDYAWDEGFMYRDKIIDNVTIHEGKVYLIDFGMAWSFTSEDSPSLDDYQEHRKVMINNQLQPFLPKN